MKTAIIRIGIIPQVKISGFRTPGVSMGISNDSYAMRKFTSIDFMTEAVPDETTCEISDIFWKHMV